MEFSEFRLHSIQKLIKLLMLKISKFYDNVNYSFKININFLMK